MDRLALDPRRTAFVSIDLQHGIVARPWAPYTGAEIVQKNVALANALRAQHGTVVWVRVDLNALLSLPADAPPPPRPAGSPPLPAEASAFVPELGIQDGDVQITKRHWGAFHATDLDLQLRRRDVRTIVIAGIATNFGVESTARSAFDRGYELVFVEDAMGSSATEVHEFPLRKVFPRMGRVRSTAEVLAALAPAA